MKKGVYLLFYVYLGTDDTVAAVEILCVHVHGASLALGTTALATRQLGQHAQQRHAHDVRPAVRSIRRDHRIVRIQSRFHARTHGFL